ncbi:hypothetical protein T439DRAFT_88534 [Meredithblackwellia eburnea MCA 4105]
MTSQQQQRSPACRFTKNITFLPRSFVRHCFPTPSPHSIPHAQQTFFTLQLYTLFLIVVPSHLSGPSKPRKRT